jgi:hypothetical protein
VSFIGIILSLVLAYILAYPREITSVFAEITPKTQENGKRNMNIRKTFPDF